MFTIIMYYYFLTMPLRSFSYLWSKYSNQVKWIRKVATTIQGSTICEQLESTLLTQRGKKRRHKTGICLLVMCKCHGNFTILGSEFWERKNWSRSLWCKRTRRSVPKLASSLFAVFSHNEREMDREMMKRGMGSGEEGIANVKSEKEIRNPESGIQNSESEMQNPGRI